MHVKWWAYRREYLKQDSDFEKRQSEWTEILEAGKEYYIESNSVSWSDSLTFSVAVEIEQTEIKDHYHARREIQYVGIEITDVREKTRITISDLDEDESDTKFVLSFQDPKTLKYTQSQPISTKSHPHHFRLAIRQFYKSTLNADVAVTGEYFDKDGNSVEKSSRVPVVKRVYTITLDRLIDGITTSKILVAKTNTKATIKVELPDDVQRSSAPIGG